MAWANGWAKAPGNLEPEKLKMRRLAEKEMERQATSIVRTAVCQLWRDEETCIARMVVYHVVLAPILCYTGLQVLET